MDDGKRDALKWERDWGIGASKKRLEMSQDERKMRCASFFFRSTFSRKGLGNNAPELVVQRNIQTIRKKRYSRNTKNS